MLLQKKNATTYVSVLYRFCIVITIGNMAWLPSLHMCIHRMLFALRKENNRVTLGLPTFYHWLSNFFLKAFQLFTLGIPTFYFWLSNFLERAGGMAMIMENIMLTIYDDNQPVATRWLQIICFIYFFICKGKVSNFSCIKISESPLNCVK